MYCVLDSAYKPINQDLKYPTLEPPVIDNKIKIE